MEPMTGFRAFRLLLSMACVLAWSSAAWAGNPHLERARRQLDDLKYEDAAASLEQALRTGESDPKELAVIYQLSAQVAAARGDEASAEDFFRHLLALAPGTTLPGGVSPKIAEPFAAARAFIDQKLPISVRWEPDTSTSAVRVLVDADPLSMVDGAEVVWMEDGEAKREVKRGAAPYVVQVPKRKKLALRISAIDAFGNHIAEFGSEKKPLVIDTSSLGDVVVVPPGGGDEHHETHAHGGSVFGKWWLWGSVAVVAAGAGTYFGLDVLAAKNEIEDLNKKGMDEPVQFSEALAIQQRGDRSALIANISFGVAGAAAVTAVVMYVMHSKDDAAPSESTDHAKREESRLVPAVGAGQVGLVWTGSF
jgi:hypothetical protein